METLVIQLVSGRVGFRPRPRDVELILWTPSLDALPVAGITQPTCHRGVNPAWPLQGTQADKANAELVEVWWGDLGTLF